MPHTTKVKAPRAKLASLAAIVAVTATASCDSGRVEMPTVVLEPFASTTVPLSDRDDGVLVDENVLCVTNSFEVRVECVARDGSVVGVFGRQGGGPGEFEIAPGLVRGTDGTVGAISQNRLTVFEPSGLIVSETRLPVVFLQPAAPFDATILGHHFGGGAELTVVELDVATGDIVWERQVLDANVETECGRVSIGVASPGGGWTFPACQRELVFLEHRDDPTPTIIVSPTYVEEYPNERDIAQIEHRNSRSFLRLDVDVYRETPKRNHLRVGSLAYDDHDRLWVATERDRARFSYFDIYVGTDYAGSARVQGRLLAYDLHGSTLVALVEREPDTDGIGWRAADWYGIGHLDLGMR